MSSVPHDIHDLMRSIGSFNGITCDSRCVYPGYVFVTGVGSRADGRDFLDEAALRGASVIVSEGPKPQGLKAPYLETEDFRSSFAELCCAFYGDPSRSMKVVGITGTCGKTTSSYLLENILGSAGLRTGVIGSVSYRYPGFSQEATHTTPPANSLQALLAAMKRASCSHIVMEVSSHSIVQSRILGTKYDVAVFTNFSLEHQDVHSSLEDYFSTKARLFCEYLEAARNCGKTPAAVVNVGDDWGRRLIEAVDAFHRGSVPILTYSLEKSDAAFTGNRLTSSAGGIQGQIDGIPIRSSLLGRFNAENILCAVTASVALGIPKESIEAGVATLSAVPGRLEVLGDIGEPRVIVDYAHKPAALLNLLNTVRELGGAGRLLVVFGCGGDRDPAKRPEMGAIAARLSDRAWVTADNPRTENLANIIADILRSVGYSSIVTVEPDRQRAIEAAIGEAQPGDYVVLAGKGPERTQVMVDESGELVAIPFDERAIALHQLALRRSNFTR